MDTTIVESHVGEAGSSRGLAPPSPTPASDSLYGHHGHWKTTTFGARRKLKRVRAMFDWYLQDLPRDARVLEIGPGRGELADVLRERGTRYVGLEPSTELHADLEARGFDVLCSSVPPIPLGDGSVDAVYSVDVFEHFQTYREAMGVCVEAYRVLKPGGALVIVAPNAETLGRLFYEYEYQHAFVTNKGRLEEMVRDAGFQVEKSRAFLTVGGLSPWWPLDRLAAHLLIPLGRSAPFIGAFRVAHLDRLLFRVHKVLCDHVGLVARKPLDAPVPAQLFLDLEPLSIP
ncbi:MAG: class I SAM-dependent methyltransferase [Gemmatimonadetes bacterium]|nr:class I SAM-dependent methyltransferase [Gemmatimonadota bacterium]